eukprot:2309005-Prorocentrum_lima.AAC.1
MGRRFAGDRLLIRPFDPDKVAFLFFVDAAHQNLPDGSSQAAYLGTFAERGALKGCLLYTSDAADDM